MELSFRKQTSLIGGEIIDFNFFNEMIISIVC
jgi:hypothetical protein